MLDLEFIRQNQKLVERAILRKRLTFDLNRFLLLDEQRRQLITRRDALLAERNTLNIEESKTRGPVLKQELRELEEQLRHVEPEFRRLHLEVPQIPADEAPDGDETASVEVKRVGEPTNFSFEPKDHVLLGKTLGILDLERGVQTAGFRGYYLKNEAVLLHYGLMQFGLEIMRKHGFTLMAPPTKVREFALTGSGHFPFGRSEAYEVANAARMEDESTKEPAFLVGTAEPSLLAYFANEVLATGVLPQRVAGISPCYRSEVGSYGKDVKGLYRIHEFMKVEQVVLCRADDAEQMVRFQEMLSVVEELLGALKLPYRFLDVATGDMGPGKVRMYDVETWMPSRNGYGETHSCSAIGDWQARRFGIRYRDEDGKIKHVYTLNNTVVASPRILIAILENHQQADGSVRIPEPLQPYVGSKQLFPR